MNFNQILATALTTLVVVGPPTTLGAAAASDETPLPVEASLSLDPLVRLLGCLQEDKPGYCFQKRALGYFESWMTTSEDEDSDGFDGDASGDSLPAGITPQLSKFVDQVAERISNSYGADDDDDDDDKEGDDDDDDDSGSDHKNRSNDTKLQTRGAADVDGRGHKKKKIKAVRRALIKLVLIALLIKSKLKILLTAFQTLLGFKGAILITVLVVTHAVKLWAEIKHHQTPQKVVYYENAHHQHHYDHPEHEDHHGWSSLWGRSGDDASTTQKGASTHGLFSGTLFARRRTDGDVLAYGAHDPESNDVGIYGDPGATEPLGFSDGGLHPSTAGYRSYYTVTPRYSGTRTREPDSPRP